MIPLARSTVVLALVAAGIGGIPSCRSAPSRTPVEIASDIAQRLVSDDESGAEKLFASSESSGAHLDAIYSVVYSQSERRFLAGDYAKASRLLGFLVRHYPRATAPREALVYTRFLERARRRKPSSEPTRRSLLRDISSLREQDRQPPVWLDLVEAQTLIDGDSIALASSALARFTARWDGDPPALRPYLEEMQAYVETRSED